MARVDAPVLTSIPDGVSSLRTDRYQQDGTGGTFDLGLATGIAFDALQAAIQSALDGAYSAGDYVVTGDADDFTVEEAEGAAHLVADFTDLTGDTTDSQTQVDGPTALDASAGAMFVNNGATRVLVRNNGAANHTVTFVSPQTILGLAVADLAYTVKPGQSIVVGPFNQTTFMQTTGDDKGKTYVNASGTQSEVTIAPFVDS
jgi:hypothetical protein